MTLMSRFLFSESKIHSINSVVRFLKALIYFKQNWRTNWWNDKIRPTWSLFKNLKPQAFWKSSLWQVNPLVHGDYLIGSCAQEKECSTYLHIHLNVTFSSVEMFANSLLQKRYFELLFKQTYKICILGP